MDECTSSGAPGSATGTAAQNLGADERLGMAAAADTGVTIFSGEELAKRRASLTHVNIPIKTNTPEGAFFKKFGKSVWQLLGNSRRDARMGRG